MIVRLNHLFLGLMFAGIFILSSCSKDTPRATLIIANANIWTGNDQQSRAQSMAIAGDTLLAIGTNEAMQKWKGTTTEEIDMNGQFITPGFIDSHVHLLTGGRSLLSVELRDASTPEEFTKRIADHAKRIGAGEWILEGNWDHTLWGGELPRKEWIDEYTQENPVVLYRLDGHMVLANSAALAFAGIDEHTPDVANGTIVRDQKGFPTGILKSNAMDLLLDKIPTMTPVQQEASFRAAMKYFLSNGVTSVHDVDSLESYPIANQLHEAGALAVRIYSIKPIYKWKELAGVDRKDNKWIKRGGLKGFVDGSLGSHTAAFHHAYTDKADDKGFFIYDRADLYEWIKEADQAKMQVMVHAIGDHANHALLNIFERVITENGARDRRFRIEHAQHVAPADIPRFAQLGVITSMQPYHAIDDGRWAEEVIGAERIKTTYAFKSLLDAKTTLAFGSDWAVAPASPLLGIYAAATRRTLDGKNPDGWVPEQKIAVEAALLAYTKNAAYASFEEHLKGTLAPGKLADFVVLSDDVTKVDPTTIKDLQVLQTYVGGKKMYEYE